MKPQRTCLGCRRSDDQDNLVRLVRVADEVVEATSPRLPGRGGYLHGERACLETALKHNALQRAFGRSAKPAPSLTARFAQIAPGWNQSPSGE